jgi:predicted transcriptional regulator
MSLGELQADILGALQKLGKASVREIMAEVGEERKIAYTTVSTVLDRLYTKGLVKRTKTTGRGGAKYVYSYAASPDMRTSLVQRTLNQLVSAFGPPIVPTIYDSLEQISKEETDKLKRKVAKAHRGT